MKSKTSIQDFGKKLVALRKAQGLTQTELADKMGVTRRVIVYYEGEAKYPPTHLLVPMAKALRINVEELLGLKKSDISESNHAALWRRLKKAEALSKSDQKALLKVLEALLIKNNSSKVA
jgi:transcriptional regulator with XRE-family HTH domain